MPEISLFDGDDVEYVYQAKIYKSGQCNGNQLSATSTSDWYGAPVVYNTSNAGAPVNSSIIKEIQFKDADGTALLGDLKC